MNRQYRYCYQIGSNVVNGPWRNFNPMKFDMLLNSFIKLQVCKWWIEFRQVFVGQPTTPTVPPEWEGESLPTLPEGPDHPRYRRRTIPAA